MGIRARLRQLSPAELAAIQNNPDEAYRLILGRPVDDFTKERLRERAEQFLKEASALSRRYEPLLSRVRQANMRREPPAEEDREELRRYQTEYAALAREAAGGDSRNRSEDEELPSVTAELDLDKSWHGIHFLLTGKAEGGSPPLADAILGGTPVPDRKKLMAYGPALKLSPEQVRDVAAALAELSAVAFLASYDAAEMRKLDVYAAGENEEEDREYFQHFFEQLRSHYSDAASKNRGMLIYLT